MIQKLKRKFIALSMISLFILLFFIVAGMNIINYASMTRESDTILGVLSKNKGSFMPGNLPEDEIATLPPHMSPEVPHETRFFTVMLQQDGTVIRADVSKTVTIDEERAGEYASRVYRSGRAVGFVDTFRYMTTRSGDQIRVVFLDCGRKMEAFYTFLTSSVGMALIGYVLISLFLVFFSGRIISPVAQSYEKQKRFITDAGHELKTPLTIIQANADLAVMEYGTNEYTTEIKVQAKRLADLTGRLVLLSRMEETRRAVKCIDFPVSDVVAETAATFQAPAQLMEKKLSISIEPMLTLCADEQDVRRLVTILLDNALKYSPSKSDIEMRLERKGRTLTLSVSNATVQTLSADELSLLFDRFYRTDRSRNSATGGHGIGLSVAKAIAESYGGYVSAHADVKNTLTVTVQIPM